MTRTIKTKEAGDWKVSGVNFTHSDSIVECIKKAVSSFNTPDDIADYIAKHFGQRPRNVFMKSKEIVFTSF